ncbi:MAG: hypothetical protein ACRDQA_25945, partial [Nocardioidaceae bacterium]
MSDDTPSWEQVKKLLDDPNVPDAQKAVLAKAFEAYDDDWAIFGTEDRVEPYLDKYGGGYWDTAGKQIVDPFTSKGTDGYLKDAYNSAKKSSGKSDAADKKHNSDIKTGRQDLENAERKAGDGGVGVSTSDKLLDAGKPGLRFYKNFLPLYDDLPGTVKTNPPKGISHGNTLKQVETRYNEHRGIDFKKFENDASELIKSVGTERDQHTNMSNTLGNLWHHWTGQASDSSQQAFGDLAKDVQKVTKTLEDVGNVSKTSMHSIAAAVRKKATWVLNHDKNSDLYQGKYSPEQIKVVIKCASGKASDEELKQAAGYVGVNVDDGSCDDDNYKQKVPVESIKFLNGFARCVDGKLKGFIDTCDNCKGTVNDAFKALTKQLAKVEGNPFKESNDSGHHEGHDNNRGDKSGSRPGNNGGGGHSSGGTSGGGDTGGQGQQNGKPPETTDVGDKGGDQPDTTDPSQIGTDPSQQGGNPNMPTPGGPNQQGQPETVTVQNGDGKIQMSSPDGQGHMTVTVDDGSGKPKTYDVDFGQGTGSSDTTPPGTVPQGDSPGTGQPGTGGPGSPSIPVSGADGQGTAGAPDQQGPDGQAAQEVHAGPDGKAVIHDGDETITLQRSEDDPSQVKMTVDDGSGEPTSYTVDYATSGVPP